MIDSDFPGSGLLRCAYIGVSDIIPEVIVSKYMGIISNCELSMIYIVLFLLS